MDGITHAINTHNHPLNSLPVESLLLKIRRCLSYVVNEMLQNNVIEDSSRPWSSPVVLVKRKNGQLHFCVNYGCLNAITRKDDFPIPRIDNMLVVNRYLQH